MMTLLFTQVAERDGEVNVWRLIMATN